MADLTKIITKLADELESFLTGVRELVETVSENSTPTTPRENLAVYIDTSGSTIGNLKYADHVNAVVDALDGEADFFTWDGTVVPFIDTDGSQTWCGGGTPSVGQLVQHQRENGYPYILFIGDGLLAPG